jgi:predicted enzyme related to lactoylglutathione lyase
MAHKVVHREVMGGEEGALPRFYSKLFGWSMQTPPGFPDSAHLARAESAGGTTVMPRTAIPGMVAMALFVHPAGNIIGLVEAETPPA